MNEPAAQRADLAARLTLVVCTALFFFPVLTGDAVLFARDTLVNNHPMRWVAIRQLAHGELPLWNPALFLGQPLMANGASQALYPPAVIFALLPFEPAFQYYILLHTLLMGLSAHALLRQWRLSSAASLWGALALAFNSVVLQFTNNIIWLPAAWTPLFLLVLERAQAHRSARWAVAAALVLAMQIMGGEMQLVSWTAALGALLLWQRTPRAQLMQSSGMFAGVVTMTAGLSAVQLLASAEFGALSDRAAGVPLEQAALWSFHPARLIELLVPRFFGGNPWLHPDSAWGNTLNNSTDHSAWWMCATIALVAPAALGALRGERWRQARWLVMVAVVGTVLAFGIHTPIFAVTRQLIPSLGLFRYPEKYLFLMVFGLTMASAVGLDSVLSDPAACRRFLTGLAATVLLLGVVYLGSVLAEGALTPVMQSTVQRDMSDNFSAASAWRVLREDIAQRGALGLCALLVAWLWQRGRVDVRVAATTLLLVTMVDALSLRNDVVPVAPVSVVEAPCGGPGLVEALRERAHHEPFRIHWDGAFEVPGNFAPSDSYASAWAAWATASCRPNVGFEAGLEYVTGYSGIRLQTLEDLNREGVLKRLLPLLNVRFHAVTSTAAPSADRIPVLLFNAGQVRWEEDPAAMPRAFLVGSACWEDSTADTIRALAAPDFDPRHEVVLRGAGPATNAPAQGQVQVRYEGSQRVVIDVETSTGGYVVLSDAYYPGWNAELDGAPVVVLQANHIMRAVAVPAGRHQVIMEYRPRSVRIGLGISLACLLGCVAFAFRRLATRIA